MVTLSGYTMTQGELLYSLPSSVTKNTYTTQAPISAIASSSIPRCLIPAGYFTYPGKALRLKAEGTITSVAGTATFVYAGGLDAAAGTIAGTGGATLFTSATLTPAITTIFPWSIDCDITCQAVGNLGTTLQSNGEIKVAQAATSVWSTTALPPLSLMFNNNLTGVNNEISLFLELFGTWSVSNAANSTTLTQMRVYGEN
jgi:hypothetical protein